MGWCKITDPETGQSVILGDENDLNNYNKMMGFPHKRDGKPISQTELDEIDKAGE